MVGYRFNQSNADLLAGYISSSRSEAVDATTPAGTTLFINETNTAPAVTSRRSCHASGAS